MIMRDVKVGEKFIFNGNIFTKLNNLGEVFAFINCRGEEDGIEYHLDPEIYVSYLN